MATLRERITRLAISIIEQHPNGIRYSDWVRQIANAHPEFKINTIHGAVWNIHERFPSKVYKPSRGVFRSVKYSNTETKEEIELRKVKEEDFYEPFADWLVSEVEDCTKAIPLGGNKFRDKWGTPDVIGKRESRKSDIIEAPIEIVSAEVKTDTNQLVTAFGQACAYCLFSHKAYLVIPKQAPDEEVGRLDSLCQVFGIGLVLFEAKSPEDPAFEIRVRPRGHQPDLFYANRYLKKIERELF